MKRTSRRTFLGRAIASAGLGLLPSTFWAARLAFAQGPLTRFDATSTQGQAMLEKYARAVAKMQDVAVTPEADPQSWLFQWYSHAVAPNTTKIAELTRVYGNTPSPRRALAAVMWDNCQAHQMTGVPQDYRMFLPWHRMYLCYFERIVRMVLDDQTFTLPYWDYTTAGSRAIPEQFRKRNDPLYKVLYRGDRNDGSNGMPNINAGQPLDQNQVGIPLSLDALGRSDYEDTGVAQGFCSELDGGLHGAIHVLVGKPTNMGSIPWAARDPIFWLHHANIDRIWVSWNKANRTNPGGTWLTTTFPFSSENGSRVDAKVGDFVDTEAIAAGPYRYDKLLPVPPVAAVAAATLVTPAPAPVAVQRSAGPTKLGGARVQVALAPTGVPTAAAVGDPTGKVYLVLQNLQAHAQPGVLYNIYLDASATAAGASATPVGSINFFGAAHEPAHSATAGRSFYSFDVTNSPAAASSTPVVRIQPSGEPLANTQPEVGSVSLVRQ